MVLISMLNTTVNEGLKVLLRVENEMRDELRDLIVEKGYCLPHSWHRIVDEL